MTTEARTYTVAEWDERKNGKRYTAEWYQQQSQTKAERENCSRCDDRGLVTVDDGTPSGTDHRCRHVAVATMTIER